jgi:hypothetical protein
MGLDINAILEADRHNDGKTWHNLGEIDIEPGTDAFQQLREFSYENRRFTHYQPLYYGLRVNQPASTSFQFMDYLDVGFDFTYVNLEELAALDNDLFVRCEKVANAHGYYRGDCRLCFYFNN